MKEKVCPLSFACSTGNTSCRTDCQLWDSATGECGLKVGRDSETAIIETLSNAFCSLSTKVGNAYGEIRVLAARLDEIKREPDRYKEMWEELRNWCDSFMGELDGVTAKMGEIEKAMGKGER